MRLRTGRNGVFHLTAAVRRKQLAGPLFVDPGGYYSGIHIFTIRYSRREGNERRTVFGEAGKRGRAGVNQPMKPNATMRVLHRLLLPRTVARVLVPASMLVLLLGMAISVRGYVFAAAGTALACALLFPAAPLFRRTLRDAWCRAGAWVYGAGSASGILMAALEPFLELYHPLHILLAFMTFLGLAGGLGCVSVAEACARRPVSPAAVSLATSCAEPGPACRRGSA